MERLKVGLSVDRRSVESSMREEQLEWDGNVVESCRADSPGFSQVVRVGVEESLTADE